MSSEAISLTIYLKKSEFPPDKDIIKKIINDELSYAKSITTVLDTNDVDVIINSRRYGLNNEFKLENARPKQIEKFFDKKWIYEGIKSIDFQFKSNDKGQIDFKLFPIYGEEIDDGLHDTRLDDFEILGYLSYHDGTSGSLDERFFDLGENIIRMLPENLTKDDHLIRFKGFDEKTEIMNSSSFYKRVIDLKNEYCNNPDLRK
ncbi:MAG: hypothetical protein KAR51_03445 [Candidatus Aenigmarchaeota archaeon]|nr:hypothetical protein [Candidatus Aenigmarchaeota archaeon]